MAKVKVDLLTKDEILYELAIRNESCDSKEVVLDLRKKLRVLVNRNAEVNHTFLSGKISMNSELDVIETKVELCTESILELTDESRPIDIARWNAKLEHCNLRLELIGKFKMNNEQSKKATKLQEQIETLRDAIKKVNVNVEEVNESVRRLSESNVEEEQFSLNDVFVEDKKELKTQEKSVLVEDHLAKNQAKSSFDLKLYEKLPNPMLEYFSKIKSCTGLVITELLEFLKLMCKIEKETGLSESVILELLVPRTNEPLRSKLIELKLCSLTAVRKEILKAFVPINLRENLVREYVNRVQHHNEPLALYVESVRSYATVLNCSYSETDLVEMIKMGINPSNRANLVFAGNPTTFRDLENLCVQCQGVEYCNAVRPKVSTNFLRNVETRKCFNCNKLGHIAKNCRKRSNQKNSGNGEN